MKKKPSLYINIYIKKGRVGSGKGCAYEIAFRRPAEEDELNGNQRFGRCCDISAHFQQFPPPAEITDNDTVDARQCRCGAGASPLAVTPVHPRPV